MKKINIIIIIMIAISFNNRLLSKSNSFLQLIKSQKNNIFDLSLKAIKYYSKKTYEKFGNSYNQTEIQEKWTGIIRHIEEQREKYKTAIEKNNLPEGKEIRKKLKEDLAKAERWMTQNCGISYFNKKK